MTAGLRKLLPQLDAFIFEDYGKGFLNSELVRQISADLNAAGKITTADPNPHQAVDWGKITAVKPNRSEALQAAGFPPTDPVDPPLEDKALLAGGLRLLSAWDTQLLLITLGEQGMMLLERNKPPHHIPTQGASGLRRVGRGRHRDRALYPRPLLRRDASRGGGNCQSRQRGRGGETRHRHCHPGGLIASFEDDNSA